MNKEVTELTKDEIKQMLIISAREDAYTAKCFANLVLENGENIVLEKFTELLSQLRNREAIELIRDYY